MTTTYEPETYPRRWLPEGVELKTWEQIEPWYQKLLAMPVDTPEQVEAWLTASGELNAVVGQEGTSRYVAMTCQTDDPAREAAYLEFVREVEPKLKPYLNEVRNKFLDAPGRAGLPTERYHVFSRSLENRRALYREANIPRETRLAELEQQYQKAVGAMTVEFQGQERTLAQLSPFLESPDREVRRQAWTLAAERRLVDREKLDELFDEMKGIRLEIAREAGFADYVAYAYRNRERFDYGPADAAKFHEAIEKTVVPLAAEIHREHRAGLGVDSLRPWDLSADPLGRPPLKPFEDVDRLAEGAEAIFREVDPELADQFGYMREHKLLDLANRKGKAPGGYQTTFEADRLPFIFMNAVGVDSDVRTLLHEGGHAFHTLASRGEPLAAYRECPLEFCEVASMTMELLGAGVADPFYDGEQAERSYRKLLEGIVTILPWIATVDAFQHWIYTNPDHTRDERRAAWRGLIQRFGGDVDWSGLEEARDHSWHRQLHIFLYPFYYIEYGLAQLGALQIWKRSLTNRPAAVASYRKALAIGGAAPLPQLFKAAGAHFAFDAETIAPLMATIGEELNRLAP
ncbi:M3 family oligoendopeptidase [Planctomyces sp. SH-PL62]|uniref:M3 family oligoendopeptidase n=1 Tax=Planctomyces sp. SH-PL62 TaxID=1636152 RepID=UPI00078D9D4B|nr:M3 family oligoendopeptidase [Planctomyces sp. SH-PL62]AMV40134.1 Peptidase family M3 [Planctomyces sp. SH-PL62]